MNGINKILDRICAVSNLVAAFLLIPTLIIVVSYDVLWSSIFRAPPQWSQDVVKLILLSVFLLTIPYVSQRGEHLRVDLLYAHFGDKAKRAVDALAAFAGMFTAAYVAYRSGFIDAVEAYQFDDATFVADIPTWPFRSLMAASGVLIFITFTVRFVQAFLPIPPKSGGRDG